MKEVKPKETTRAYAFEMWMNAPMPMLTFFKTVNVTRLVRISKRTGLKFNMLMCWCVGKAASSIKEFYMLPVGKKLMLYDNLAVCTIVANREGEVSSCDVPFSDNLQQFNADYLRLTKQVAESCRNHDLTDSMVIGTSALAQYEIDGAVGMYSGVFNNPFLIWGKYKRHWWKRTLTISFQFMLHASWKTCKRKFGTFMYKAIHIICDECSAFHSVSFCISPLMRFRTMEYAF